MAENGGGGGGDGVGEETAAALRAGAAPRPTIALPPRSSFESLFRGGASEVSPGPLTLVSSFFAEDADSECRSFTQLLVGAINSPVARRAGGAAKEQGKEAEKLSDGGEEDEGGGGLIRSGHNRPPSLEISRPHIFTVPPGLSPAGLLDSPAFFSSALGNFAMSHQEALAQVTAQAAHSPFTMLTKAEIPSPFSTELTNFSSQLIQESPKPTHSTTKSVEGSETFNKKSQLNTTVVDKPSHDGYNWRKYGQKIVKGSEYPRSYYKCTHPKCPVKKKLERSVDGQVTEIIYKGRHNHECPEPNKRTKEGNPSRLNGTNEHLDNLEPGSLGGHGNFSKPNNETAALFSNTDQESGYGSPDQLSGSSDVEEVIESRPDEGDEDECDPKRRNMAASSQKTSNEPRIIVQTRSEVDLLDDGYRWRKYGQKVVKGNPNPRSYYKCTYAGCSVRKHIERSPTDPKAVVTSYEGKHNHDIPAARNSKP
ncbi:probable WRKY transcription factor 4 isoform X1 [Zingiber officinale]|uniref:WRKY domain-containing protein n=1 Tax=Zingiber officinale TaxID=94328 RepID=A0A8J5L5S3_ZINOF|nr:probable WRKY transcription factor 4 isoform X1 [Zingiber officinale]XP_042375529.1 probable WRKY transcription factor 4 isoform X1 [Zingiber officinale]KAG6513435.1 hypothetical protein ZIOFF_023760 [Zingiber officinale]